MGMIEMASLFRHEPGSAQKNRSWSTEVGQREQRRTATRMSEVQHDNLRVLAERAQPKDLKARETGIFPILVG
jgi:hypothetical protein